MDNTPEGPASVSPHPLNILLGLAVVVLLYLLSSAG